MAYCGKCGTQMEDDVKFCPNCGENKNAPADTPSEQQTYQQTQPDPAAAQPEPKDATHLFDPADIEKNKVMGFLGYLIFFIPLLAAKESKFARFHANQGFVLLLGGVLASVLWAIPILGWIAAPIVSIAVTIFTIMGIINALGGKAINLPIVGKFKIFK